MSMETTILKLTKFSNNFNKINPKKVMANRLNKNLFLFFCLKILAK